MSISPFYNNFNFSALWKLFRRYATNLMQQIMTISNPAIVYINSPSDGLITIARLQVTMHLGGKEKNIVARVQLNIPRMICKLNRINYFQIQTLAIKRRMS